MAESHGCSLQSRRIWPEGFEASSIGHRAPDLVRLPNDSFPPDFCFLFDEAAKELGSERGGAAKSGPIDIVPNADRFQICDFRMHLFFTVHKPFSITHVGSSRAIGEAYASGGETNEDQFHGQVHRGCRKRRHQDRIVYQDNQEKTHNKENIDQSRKGGHCVRIQTRVQSGLEAPRQGRIKIRNQTHARCQAQD